MSAIGGDVHCQVQLIRCADLNGASGKLNTNGGFALEGELIARKPAQQIRLSDARVTDKYNLEQVIITAPNNRTIS